MIEQIPPAAETPEASYIPVIFRRDEKMVPGSRLEAIDPKTGQLRLVFAGPSQNPHQHPEFTIKAKDHHGRDVVHIFDGDYLGYRPADEFAAAAARRRAPYQVTSATITFHLIIGLGGAAGSTSGNGGAAAGAAAPAGAGGGPA